jgi:hypothetical protein
MKRKAVFAISIVSLSAAFLVTERLGCAGVLGRSSESRALTSDWPCCAATTELIVIKRDQTARLELQNKSDQSLAVRLQFVDKGGNVLVQQEATIGPGDTRSLAYAPNSAGGAQPGEFRAQFGTEEAKLIGLLRPALRIEETASGKTVRIIGPERFKQSKLVPGPH